jgi:hypothetical protein
MFEFALLVKFPHNLEATHKAFHYIQLWSDSVLAEVEQCWLDLKVLFKVETIQVFSRIDVTRVSDDIYHYF